MALKVGRGLAAGGGLAAAPDNTARFLQARSPAPARRPAADCPVCRPDLRASGHRIARRCLGAQGRVVERSVRRAEAGRISSRMVAQSERCAGAALADAAANRILEPDARLGAGPRQSVPLGLSVDL